jgi:hypothetical protein
MKVWSLFYPLVLPEVIGAPDPMVDQALVLAAREFCQRTSVWLEWQEVPTAGSASNQFEFDVPTGAEFVKIARAVVGEDDFGVLSYRDVPADWINPSSTKLKNKLVHLEGNEFLVFPVPPESIRLQLAFKPSLAAKSVPDSVFGSYAEEIADGAKARLLGMRNLPFSDQISASAHRTCFEYAINRVANIGFAHRNPAMRVTRKSRI